MAKTIKHGVTRPVDRLGRIVIPMELRKEFGISEKSLIEVIHDGDELTLRPVHTACIFCGERDSQTLLAFEGKQICKRCADHVRRICE